MSDRPRVDYTAETFVDLIGDFVREAIGKPTIVVVHGLPGAYVIANAYRRPQLFERLMLVTPPVTMLQETVPGPTSAALKLMLRAPVAGPFIYNLLTRRSAIRSFYNKQGYYDPELVTDQLVQYTYSSAHQANSHLPAAALLSNHLNMDVHEALARLQQPVVAVWGREDVATPTEAADAFKRVNPKIEARILDRCSQQPQDEQAGQFNNLVREFAGQPIVQ
jgi:pimeloyl-ACP methyl ester carboxylesterase